MKHQQHDPMLAKTSREFPWIIQALTMLTCRGNIACFRHPASHSICGAGHSREGTI